MDTDFSLVEQETGVVKTFVGGDREPAELFTFTGFSGRIALPKQYLPSYQALLSEAIPEVLKSLRELPESSIIARIVLLPSASDSAPKQAQCTIIRNGSDYSIILLLPYVGVSMASEVFNCWSELMESEAPLARYLFGLAAIVKPALGEETPTFAQESLLWQYIMRSVCHDDSASIDAGGRPLLSLISLDGIASVLQRKNGSDAIALAHRASIIKKLDKLRTDRLNETIDRLIAIANQEQAGLVQSAAAKLVLHLGSAEQIGLINKIKEITLSDEPVGESILQKLKNIKSLECINLSGTFFPSEAVRHLVLLPRLRELNLEGTPIRNNAIVYLSASQTIEEINCSDTDITDECIKHLLEFKQLSTVHLNGTAISKPAQEQLKNRDVDVIC